MAGTIRTGMAGWVFPEWRGGTFYPEGLKQRDELHWASRAVTAIEINSSFYRNQSPASYEAWAAQTPDDFRFTVKGHQVVTHIKRLKEVDQPVELFFKSIEKLGKRLGAVCWQLPGNFKFDLDRLERFFALLPKDIRQALEVRSAAFAEPAFIDLLRAHNIALVTADTEDWPYLDLTADFAYLRLQGAPGGDHYEPNEIDAWAKRLNSWSEGKASKDTPLIATPASSVPRDVFCYFVSTDKPNAPRNALTLAAKLGVKPPTG
jgi:uncharacterized protein YecE (DUF72 family)